MFHTRTHYGMIVNYPHVSVNGGIPYIGGMIGSGEDELGVTCSYLHLFSDNLEQFLKDKTKEI